jgi:hypothetical protein
MALLINREIHEPREIFLPQRNAKFLLRIGWGEGGRRPDEVNRENEFTQIKSL